ncbi:hypothetical protein FS749_000914 [Ceratobasidium sp. UAMH 11750]|nr:hypothetical protein FS749_000914 [Ceratobasidium sp. UAMH 11750]
MYPKLSLSCILFLIWFIMSKRKIIAGGYEDSDSETSIEPLDLPNPPAKRGKSGPYAPPRIGVAPAGALGAFQVPRSSSFSSQGSAGLVPISRPTPVSDPAHLNSGPGKSERGPNTSSVDMIQSHGSAGSGVLAAPQNIPQPRSTILLEREMHALRDTFEDYKSSNDAHHRRHDEKLTLVYDIVSKLVPGLIPAENASPVPAFHPLAPANAPVLNPKPYLSNPLPTPELIATISKVVAEARNRVGKKKGGPDDNSVKEHARTTFYRMLGIPAAKSIQPYFEDEFGAPDTLPIRFADPETKYCQPYPHWKAPLVKQVAWVPTFILRFRATIANDQSELSTLLHNLSDEQIVILLNDGPFKSCQTAWREMKKSDEEIEVMRANARRYQRADRKATIRSQYLRAIPSMAGPDWEYISHPGYVSQDESDDEGGLITKRPEYRSQWETNLYEAIRVAELDKARARPGLCPRGPPRRIELVKRPVPQLERGTGNHKVVIRIPLCAISKSWRDSNPDELKKYAHLINTKVTAKPDISAFLGKYPMPKHEEDDYSTSDRESNGVGGENDGRQSGAGYANKGGAPSDSHPIEGNKGGIDESHDYKSGGTVGDADMEDTEEGFGTGGFAAQDGLDFRAEEAARLAAQPDFKDPSDVLIDPQLELGGVNRRVAQLESQTQPHQEARYAAPKVPALTPGVTLTGSLPAAIPESQTLRSAVSQPAPASHPPPHVHPSTRPFDMPSPPPLTSHPSPVPSDTIVGPTTTRVSKRQSRKTEPTTVAVASGLKHEIPDPPTTAQASDAPPPKRRGRPLGSKNKPKS